MLQAAVIAYQGVHRGFHSHVVRILNLEAEKNESIGNRVVFYEEKVFRPGVLVHAVNHRPWRAEAEAEGNLCEFQSSLVYIRSSRPDGSQNTN